jgi:nucleoid DNA-binding protein
MTKKEIARKIAETVALPQSVVIEGVQMLFDVIVQILLEEGRIELRNFSRQRAARHGGSDAWSWSWEAPF